MYSIMKIEPYQLMLILKNKLKTQFDIILCSDKKYAFLRMLDMLVVFFLKIFLEQI